MSHMKSANISRRGLLATPIALATTASFIDGSTAMAQTRAPRRRAIRHCDERFVQLGALVTRRMEELGVPGVALGVLADGRAFTAGFGVTHVDHPHPVDEETLFLIGSTSKTFTATTMMRLVEQERLHLDAPVRAYLPDFRVADERVARDVQVRDLLTHTSGWYGDRWTETGNGDDALAQFVDTMADLPQLVPFGEYFSYNNAAVAVAGRLVEVVTGQTYEAATRQLLLDPLGLAQTFFFPEEVMTQAFAVGHAAPPDDPHGAPIVVEPWAVPRGVHALAGGISSVADQLRYARFHLGDGTVNGVRLLEAASIRAMQQPLGPGGSFGRFVLDGVGLTWMLSTLGAERIVMHGGGGNAQQSAFLLVPERGFAVTVLTNAAAGAELAEEVTLRALKDYLGITAPPLTPIDIDRTPWGDFVADYDFGEGRVISVSRRGRTLALQITADGQNVPGGSGPLPLVAPDRGAFRFNGATLLTDFVRDDGGDVRWLRFASRMLPRLD